MGCSAGSGPYFPGSKRRTWLMCLRHLERRLPVSGLERGTGCHPERSEGSLRSVSQTLRCGQGGRHSLKRSRCASNSLTLRMVRNVTHHITDTIVRTLKELSAIAEFSLSPRIFEVPVHPLLLYKPATLCFCLLRDLYSAPQPTTRTVC